MFKRKTITIIIIFFSFSFQYSYSQSICDFFTMLPDSSVLGLSKTVRQNMVKYCSDNSTYKDAADDMQKYNLLYAFEICDIKNGYIKITGAMEGQMELCYWKKNNGNKVIAVYAEGCGPICDVVQFDFYEYDGKNFKALDTKKVIPVEYNDFVLGENQKKLMEAKDITSTMLFKLPRSGKNIETLWGNAEDVNTYKPYAKGTYMLLVWNDGIFKKGNFEWK